MFNKSRRGIFQNLTAFTALAIPVRVAGAAQLFAFSSMENTGTKRTSGEFSGLSPAPKDPRIGEQSPTNVDIDKGQTSESLDETGGLAPQMQPLGAHALSPPKVASGVSGSITLEAIGDLMDQKLTPISESISQILGDLTQFKDSVRKELNTLGLKLSSVETETSNALSKISVLELELQQLKIDGKSEKSNNMANVSNNNVVIGNIPGGDTFEGATAWVKKRIDTSGLNEPIDMFFKTKYAGLVFVKYGSTDDREKLISNIEEFAKKTMSLGPKNVFAKVDQPIDIRMAESCLFRMKRMLTGWGYNKSCIKVETGERIKRLLVANKEVVTAHVQDYKLILQWSDGDWEAWDSLQSSEEFSTIKNEVQGRLSTAKELGGAKGKGKSTAE